MRKLLRIPLFALVIGAVGIAFGSGCYATSASAGFYASDPPPAEAEVYVGERPGHVWINGHWAWSYNTWVWAPGYWVTARTGYVYTDGYWYYDSYWRYRPGIWVRSRPGYVWGGGYWGTRGGRRIWIRGGWVRGREGHYYSGGRWIRRGGSATYRRGPAAVRDHRTYRSGPTYRSNVRYRSGSGRTYRSGGGGRVRRR